MAKLVLISPAGDGEPKEFVLPMDRVVIARDTSGAVTLLHGSLPRFHARVTHTPEGWYFEDLDPTNDCLVNNVAVKSAILHDHDVLDIGPARFRFELGAHKTFGSASESWVN